MRLKLGTRGSDLALWQSRHVAAELQRRHEGLIIEEQILKTEGDLRVGETFGAGDRGVFVKAIEHALLAGEIDFAVHSLKDLPSADADGLVIAAVPPRVDPRDALVSRDGIGLDDLADAAIVGTGSPRRRGQLLFARPDLKIRGLRGNIDTRAGKVHDGTHDAVVLAAAGLLRLGLSVPWVPIDPEICLPAVGQGALAIQARADDAATIKTLQRLEDGATRAEIVAERAFLAELGGGCLAPATAWARATKHGLCIDAMVAAPDGSERLFENCACTHAAGADEARRLAQRLNARGAQRWIESSRNEQTDGA